ncbi:MULTISPECIES: toxic anion resistance protein [unclassified Campylobacter]|uniref:toxic anion resistance protein n=1 Tax=unclassified Campylobacter TaxID=2593542 RepID=UPI0022E9B372|nr:MULTISPECIES: toxic anion resistance protein [unclassified Campylobacter]MDA3055161.1 toxic anion resistance protein [Campylobacter sp. VBCF_07 NA4]MDA3070930.1 toxic anion resistance protein [Campylobacter sp. VBCF_08 NA3]
MTTDLIVNTIKNSEVNLANAVFKDEINQSDKEKINEKAMELLAFLSGKDSAQIREILESITIADTQKLENSSSLLSVKISQLQSIESDKSYSISKSLIKLNDELSAINPYKFNFTPSKILSFLPFVGKPINAYLKKFKTAKATIDETLSHLEEGQKLLREDNAVLDHEKEFYKQSAISLQKKAIVFEQLVRAIEQNLEKFLPEDKKFYENNLLLNLNKKIRSIYEILAVTRQGFLSSDQIANTNYELIDNISNVKIVTKRALEIGVAMAVSLENQKNVMQAVEKTKSLADEIILQNAKKMNEQSDEIFAMSSKGTLNLENLKEAFSQIDEALNKMDTLKEQSLKNLKTELENLKEITDKLDEKVKANQKIEKFKSEISLEF